MEKEKNQNDLENEKENKSFIDLLKGNNIKDLIVISQILNNPYIESL